MGQSARLSVSATVVVLVGALSLAAAAAQDQPSSTTAAPGPVRVVSATVDPEPARIGRALRVTGDLEGITAEVTGNLLLGDADLGEVLVAADGAFEANLLVPAGVAVGAYPLQLDLGGAGTIPLDEIAVVESTGIDLSAALSSTLADDTEPVEADSEPAEEPPPPSAAAPTTVAAAVTTPTPADRTDILIVSASAAILLLGAVMLMMVRRRRAVPDPGGTVVFKGGKPVPEAAGRGAAPSPYRAADHDAATSAGDGQGVPGRVTRTVDLTIDSGSAFEVVQFTQSLSTSARQETVIARTDSPTVARQVMRDAWAAHRPESRSQETWWEIRRTSTASALWIMNAGSDREFQVDGATK